jgi:hypothetical protein
MLANQWHLLPLLQYRAQCHWPAGSFGGPKPGVHQVDYGLPLRYTPAHATAQRGQLSQRSWSQRGVPGSARQHCSSGPTAAHGVFVSLRLARAHFPISHAPAEQPPCNATRGDPFQRVSAKLARIGFVNLHTPRQGISSEFRRASPSHARPVAPRTRSGSRRAQYSVPQESRQRQPRRGLPFVGCPAASRALRGSARGAEPTG